MRRGYTLIEVLVTLVILAAAASVVAPAVRRADTAAHDVTKELHRALMWTWRQAAERGVDARFAVDPLTGKYWAGADDRWPTELWVEDALELTDGITIAPDSSLLTVRIQSNGRSTNAIITVKQGSESIDVVVDGAAGSPHIVTRRNGSD